MMEILIPILAVTVIGLICAVGLAVASSVMAVKEDTRFTEIRECLPGANCGACGYTGCDGYAKALLEPGTKTNLCVPGADAVAAQIAALLGVAAEDVVEKIAVVQCAGTCEATSVKADYRGIPSCAAAKLFYGGNGSCIFGCMGFGDCVKACPQGAISMQDGIACVNHTACIGCGICAQTCPQKIIEIVPDIIRTEAYHFMGSNQKMPAFELNDAHCALEVENTETTVTIKSGNTKLVIGKNPCSFDYYYKDKKLTSIGNRFGNAMISTISTPDGNYMRAQMNLDIGEKVYGLGERFTPYVKNGQTVEIDAPQNCAENRYVGRMTVDGKVTGKTFLEYGELLGGAKIAFGMQPEPDKDRGAKPGDAPYSMSREDCR